MGLKPMLASKRNCINGRTKEGALSIASCDLLQQPCACTVTLVFKTFGRRIHSGGARRDRTDDLMLAKHALSQLSYGPFQRERPERQIREYAVQPGP